MKNGPSAGLGLIYILKKKGEFWLEKKLKIKMSAYLRRGCWLFVQRV